MGMSRLFFKCFVVAMLLLFVGQARAQHFSGTQGSVYSPVINTFSQPASGADMPMNWSVEIFGVNSFWANNILDLSPARFDWQQDSIDLRPYVLTGDGERGGGFQADVHLLNFLLRIPRHEKWVVGAGWNIRFRLYADHLNYNYLDSMETLSEFLKANAIDHLQKGRLLNQQWMEWFVNASVILRENKFEKLAVGGSLKLTKGMSAEVIDITGLQLTPQVNGHRYSALTRLSGRYGYSENLEDLDDNQNSDDQVSTFTNGSPFSLGLDVGISYTQKNPVWIAGFTNKAPTDYRWKLSLAITDLGRLKYPLGEESRMINGVSSFSGMDSLIRDLESASSLTGFNDTLSRVASIAPWQGDFSISLPTAIQIGYDQHIGHHLFLHAHLVLDAAFLNPGADYKLHTINYLTLTPRWEIKHWGIYAPLYLNDRGIFMAGAAVRLGPLTAGVHDFKWLFSHSRSGGGYVALTIKRFFKEKEECFSF